MRCGVRMCGEDVLLGGVIVGILLLLLLLLQLQLLHGRRSIVDTAIGRVLLRMCSCIWLLRVERLVLQRLLLQWEWSRVTTEWSSLRFVCSVAHRRCSCSLTGRICRALVSRLHCVSRFEWIAGGWV